MALIIDPDNLNDSAANDNSTEVFINTATKRIKLVVVGNLSTDGVTMKALYSFLKEEWTLDPNNKNLAAFPLPLVPIGDGEYEFVEGWNFEDSVAQYLIRNSGWTVRNISGNVTEQWAGIKGLGSIESNDQPYYALSNAVATDFQLQGQVNQAIQILSDPNGDGAFGDGYDRRGSFNLFLREQAQLFGKADLNSIGETALAGKNYAFPLGTGADLKISTADTGIKASGTGYPADIAPYSGMSITYHATPQSRTVGASSYNFGITVDGNGQSLQEIYEFIQYALRQNVDIAAGAATVIGKTADPLAYYVGDTFYTQAATNPEGGGTGVWIANFDTNDINSIVLVDNTGSQRTFPYTASVTINFNDNLVADVAAEYTVYFTTLPAVARTVSDAAITAAGTTLTSATAAFTSTDKDALVKIAGAGAGGAALYARIVSVTSGTTVEVTPAAGTTVTGAALDLYGSDWGEAGAVITKDASGTPMADLVPGASVTHTFDYDGNTQGGRTPGTDAGITVVALGLTGAQYVRAVGTIQRSTSNVVTLVAPLERTYANP